MAIDEYEDEYTKQLRKLYIQEHPQSSRIFLIADLIARVVCILKGHETPRTPAAGGESCDRCGKFWKT
jgi:hypothetical protein